MSVLFDASSGKVCSIVLPVTLRKYQCCLMSGEMCSIFWE